MTNSAGKLYLNSGNEAVLSKIRSDCRSVLDVGCGDGANSRLMKARWPDLYIEGITHSLAEANLALSSMNYCHVADIECDISVFLEKKFDTILFSHVLEHLRSPEIVVARFAEFLNPGGQILIAVPNILEWRTRFSFLRGNFNYQEFGVLDNTHLRFFTYLTADDYLLSKLGDEAGVNVKYAEGSVPLWLFRRILPPPICKFIDEFGTRYWPNLFGTQTIVDFRSAKV